MEIIIPVLLVLLGIICYLYSVSTRKYYTCPECGEKFRTEHMEASHCSTCGAELHFSNN